MSERILLIDVGNTNTDFAVATADRILRVVTVPTARLSGIPASVGGYQACVLASVVPTVTRRLQRCLAVRPFLVGAGHDLGIRIRYPNKHQIGADRLANAVALVRLYGAPAIAVDFGTALTFDVVNASGEFVGGVIAPGLAAMTHYLHEHTALLPRIRLREPRGVLGKSTVGAMRIGAVIGYRGLVKEILGALRRQPGLEHATVVATGGYARLIARRLPEIQHVNPKLTLEGLRFIYRHRWHESN
ncbi:MAG: type III pantothenate kinase [Verrucomicrobiae bacterium]|nr:type III pantothenate kinase [Verrucomicrobiae bacterium]